MIAFGWISEMGVSFDAFGCDTVERFFGLFYLVLRQ